MKRIWLIAPIGIIANALVSCGGDKEEVKTYFTVTFDAGGGNARSRSATCGSG